MDVATSVDAKVALSGTAAGAGTVPWLPGGAAEVRGAGTWQFLDGDTTSGLTTVDNSSVANGLRKVGMVSGKTDVEAGGGERDGGVEGFEPVIISAAGGELGCFGNSSSARGVEVIVGDESMEVTRGDVNNGSVGMFVEGGDVSTGEGG